MEQAETIIVKGMVCNRCIMALRQAVEEKGMRIKSITLGNIMVHKNESYSYASLYAAVSSLGFEILVEKQLKQVERIKEQVEYYLSASDDKLRFSKLLGAALGMSYDQLSRVFSEREGITLEHYIIRRRIEKVKQLLSDTNASLTDIAFQVNYSSVHYLSRQFKEVTGLNPSQYREMVSSAVI